MTEGTSHALAIFLDLEDFTSRSHRVKISMRRVMKEIVHEAATQARLPWPDIGVKDEGDRLLLVLPEGVSADAFLTGFVESLDAGLVAAELTCSGAHRIRLRMSVVHAPEMRDGSGWTSEAASIAFALVDAPVLRRVLGAARRAHLVLAVTDDVYRLYIAPGLRGLDPATFSAVRIELTKERPTLAWIQVPGYASPPGLQPADEPEDRETSPGAARSPGPRPVTSRTYTVTGTTYVHGDQVLGDKNVYGPMDGRR
jgi:hypothetical protein